MNKTEDQELRRIILDYAKYKKLEEKIEAIFYNYGYTKNFPINHELEDKYKICVEKAKNMNRVLPRVISINLSESEIINGLKNMKEREINWIDEHSYLFDAYYDGLEYGYTDAKSKKNTYERISKISNLYDTVISKYINDLNRKSKRK